MSHLPRAETTTVWVFRFGVFGILIGLAFAHPGYSQVSPEEHAKHHPGLAGGAKPGGIAVPTEGAKPAPQTTTGSGTGTAPASMPGGMGDMMKDMGKVPPKELYPMLMSLPEITPEQREEMVGQADEQMRSALALLSKGLDRLGEASQNDDYLAMQKATARMREALARFESGVSTRRALAEGRPPHQVALQWFKNEMHLQPPQGVESRSGLFGITPFHLFSMVLLITFASTMIGMYYFKMRRASSLFRRIESVPGSPPPGSAPPLAGKAAPIAADTEAAST